MALRHFERNNAEETLKQSPEAVRERWFHANGHSLRPVSGSGWIRKIICQHGAIDVIEHLDDSERLTNLMLKSAGNTSKSIAFPTGL